MKEATATFIGHDNCYSIDREKLRKTIEKLLLEGYSEFLCGGMGLFDSMCAHIVKDFQKEFPNAKVYIIIPYLSSSWANLQYYDEIVYPDCFEKYYFKAAIVKRNRYMVDNSSVAICYVNHRSNGAGKTFEYAKKQGLRIINLGVLM